MKSPRLGIVDEQVQPVPQRQEGPGQTKHQNDQEHPGRPSSGGPESEGGYFKDGFQIKLFCRGSHGKELAAERGKRGKREKLRSPGNCTDPEATVSGAIARGIVAAAGGANGPGRLVPRTATDHPALTAGGTRGIGL